jgi:hypothetical protein
MRSLLDREVKKRREREEGRGGIQNGPPLYKVQKRWPKVGPKFGPARQGRDSVTHRDTSSEAKFLQVLDPEKCDTLPEMTL